MHTHLPACQGNGFECKQLNEKRMVLKCMAVCRFLVENAFFVCAWKQKIYTKHKIKSDRSRWFENDFKNL
jgi:hypothetical protein